MLALALIGPLAAALAIFATRRRVEGVALLGAAFGFAGSLALLAGAAGGGMAAAIIPFLPGMPVRLVASPLTAVLSVVVATVALFVLIYAAG